MPRRSVPWQLPPARLSLIDRDTPRATLNDLLTRAEEESRPARVAVTGTAGIGKSALAIDWLGGVRSRFRHGLLYADLNDGERWEHTRAVLAGWVGALGAPRVPESRDDLLALYRSLTHSRRLVVLVDNARDVDQVRPLLPTGDSCLTVVTGRRHLPDLALDGFHRLELGPLDTKSAIDLLAAVLGAQRVAAEREHATASFAAAPACPWPYV